MNIVRTLVAFPGYYANAEDGFIYSAWTTGTRPSIIGSVMKKLAGGTSKGYSVVCLRKNGRNHYRTVHRLILETFIGQCPLGMECRHLNGDRTDNRLVNLCWGTRKENVDDKYKHGTTGKGESNGQSHHSDQDILLIRQLRAEGHSLVELAKQFGDNHTNISHICLGRTWKHVGGPITRALIDRGRLLNEMLETLKDGPLTTSEIAEATGLRKRSITAQLSKLKSTGRIAQDDRKWRRI